MADHGARHDVIIVGAGPAGSASAYTLAQAGMRVLMVERRVEVDFRFGELLPPHAAGLLHRFGLDLGSLIERHARARGVASVWGSETEEYQDFFFNPYGDGVRLDRPVFDRSLRDLAEGAGAAVMTGIRVTGLAIGETGHRHRVAVDGDGATGHLDARYVIDCSGRAGVVGRSLGLTAIEPDGLFAYAMRFSSTTHDNDPFLRIEALRDGWLYSLVLPSGERMVVFHTDRDLAAVPAIPEARSLDPVLSKSRSIGPRLVEGGFAPADRLRVTTAGSRRAEAVMAHGVFAAGDAAIAFDPLASRGMYSALRTGFGVADALLALDGGDETASERYREMVEADAREYRSSFAEVYGAERRFSDAPFWQRRLTDSSGLWEIPDAEPTTGSTSAMTRNGVANT